MLITFAFFFDELFQNLHNLFSHFKNWVIHLFILFKFFLLQTVIQGPVKADE